MVISAVVLIIFFSIQILFLYFSPLHLTLSLLSSSVSRSILLTIKQCANLKSHYKFIRSRTKNIINTNKKHLYNINIYFHHNIYFYIIKHYCLFRLRIFVVFDYIYLYKINIYFHHNIYFYI